MTVRAVDALYISAICSYYKSILRKIFELIFLVEWTFIVIIELFDQVSELSNVMHRLDRNSIISLYLGSSVSVHLSCLSWLVALSNFGIIMVTSQASQCCIGWPNTSSAETWEEMWEWSCNNSCADVEIQGAWRILPIWDWMKLNTRLSIYPKHPLHPLFGCRTL